jgi:hypothetical protein
MAGRRLYLPIDGTRNSNAAVQADRSTWAKVSLDLPAFINALAPNGRMHFVAVKFVPIVGE